MAELAEGRWEGVAGLTCEAALSVRSLPNGFASVLVKLSLLLNDSMISMLEAAGLLSVSGLGSVFI